jgi:NAD(P)-binding Rossmann-like domain
MRSIETDYLIVGAGAAGMAFTDALVAASDADVVVVDRRHAPGGHWQDAYPFVRLHQPSQLYGVNSRPLGNDTIDRDGLNRGLYELAGAPEICAYYDRVMQEQLLATGRVRYFPMSEYVGGHRFVSRLSGEVVDVKVRKRVVDATYVEPSVPATTPAPFDVEPGARCVPVGELPRLAEHADGFVIVGAGKTAIDACLWLLELGVAPEAIRWIKPSELWLLNRAYLQAGDLAAAMYEGFSLQIEAIAHAESLDDLFARLEDGGQVLRVDESMTPTAYRGATVTTAEVEQLRRIEDVVRLGHVRRIERDRIVLDDGEAPTSPRCLHVHCAARGLNPAPAVPVFTEDTITLQWILPGFLPFNAAIEGFVEASREDTEEKNRLCRAQAIVERPEDWLRGMLHANKAAQVWSQENDVEEWLLSSRLYWRHWLARLGDDQRVVEAAVRFGENIVPAFANGRRLLAPVAAAAG